MANSSTGDGPSSDAVRDGGESDSLHRRIGRLLADARRAAGLRQTDVARQLGMTQTRVARLESGKRRLLYVEALALSDLYGVSALAFDPRSSPEAASSAGRRIRIRHESPA